MVLTSPIPGRLAIIPGGTHWFPSFPILSSLGIFPHWSPPSLPTQEHRLTKFQCPLGQPDLDARIGAGGRGTGGQQEQEAEPYSTSRLVLAPGGWSRGHVWGTHSRCRGPLPMHQHSQDLYQGQGAPGDISTHGDTTVLWPPKAQPCPTVTQRGSPNVGAGECRVPHQPCQPPPSGYTRARDTSWGSPQGHRTCGDTQRPSWAKATESSALEQWRSGGQGHNEQFLGQGSHPHCQTHPQRDHPLAGVNPSSAMAYG